MKIFTLAAIVVASIFSNSANALVLQSGQSFEYSFNVNNLTQVEGASDYYKSMILWDMTNKNEDGSLFVEFFEGVNLSSPIASIYTSADGGGIGIASNYIDGGVFWQDKEGSFRITSGKDGLDFQSIRVSIQNPSEYYSLTAFSEPIPEPSSSALYLIGLPLLVGVYFCQKNKEHPKT